MTALFIGYILLLIFVFVLALHFAKGQYLKWHMAYFCTDCGHRENERTRYFWKVCPGCGSEASGTRSEIGREGFFGWVSKQDTADKKEGQGDE